MRFSIKILFFFVAVFLPALALSAPKNLAAFMITSKDLRLKAAKEKSFDKKAAFFKKLEKDISVALKDYEKANPVEGGNDEDLVTKFSFSLEPVSPLVTGKKPSTKECEKAKHQVEFEDKAGRGEDATFSTGAQEALEWISVFCKS